MLNIKEKINIKDILLALFYLIVCMGFNYFVVVRNLDDVNKIWSCGGMARGLKIYKDINILSTPFTYIIGMMAAKIYNSLVVIRILTGIIWLIIFYLVHKILGKYEVKKYVIVSINIISIIVSYSLNSLYYNYNIVIFMMLLAILHIIINKPFTYLNAVKIGIILGLIIWSKHIMAVFIITAVVGVIFYFNDDKKLIKKLLTIAVAMVVTSLAFIGYILYQGVWNEFRDLCFNGIGSFVGEAKDLFIGSITLAFLLFILIIVNILYKVYLEYRKENDIKKAILANKDIIIIILFTFSTFAFFIPRVDGEHFIMTIIMLLIFVAINLKDNILLGIFNIVLVVLLTVYSVSTIYALWNDNIVASKIEKYKYLPIEKEQEDLILETKKIIEKSDKKVYLLDKCAVLFNVPSNNYTGYYDYLWEGNTGAKPPIEYVKELKNKDVYILIRSEYKETNQWDENINKYVEKNFKKKKNLGFWTMYEN